MWQIIHIHHTLFPSCYLPIKCTFKEKEDEMLTKHNFPL